MDAHGSPAPSPGSANRWRFTEGEEILPGRYAIRLLGSTRVHEVYLAWDDALLGLVVVKLLQPSRVADRSALDALTREAEALEHLQHPSLPRCFDAVLEGERPHLVLELVEGPRLSTLIRRQRLLGVEQVIPLALQLCSALHYIAGRGMIHLDVKPKNVIMAPPPRLIDLSIARPIDVARANRAPIGTDRYMAPEQCGIGEEGSIGPPTDIWGLGATLFEAVTGRGAFPRGEPGASDAERFPQLVQAPRPLPRTVPAPLASVITEALRPRPEDRPTAAEIVSGLDPLAEVTPQRLLLGRFRVSAWRVPRG